MATSKKIATLYRMVMPDHMCPHGLKSKDFLERQGFLVEDHHLTTRGEIDAFVPKHRFVRTQQSLRSYPKSGTHNPTSNAEPTISPRIDSRR